MPVTAFHKTNFTAGEVSPLLLGRGDLRAFENGAGKLRNVFIHPTGGVTRRHGMRFIDAARGPGRLIAFEFNTQQVYLLVLTNLMADIYQNGVHVGNFVTPWSASQLTQLNWTQSADTLLVVHPNVPPKKITRMIDHRWDVADWSFYSDADRFFNPHFKFADANVTLQASATVGAAWITSSAPVFHPEHVGIRLRLDDKEAQIAQFISNTAVIANVKQPLSSTNPTLNWTEQALSPVRGWPISVCFHQDRLVIGGSRDLPNLLWLSKSSDIFNFDYGQGLDDEAMEFQILSDQVNAIRYVFSGRHLQVFTSGAEWMVAGDPLTPSTIQLHRQTRVGSPVDRTIPPRDVDGATLFVQRIGEQLRELLFTDAEQAYHARDLAILAEHIFYKPIDMDFDKTSRLLHVVMSNGRMGTLTVYRDEGVSAWTLQETAGAFRSVATVGDDTYALVERAAGMSVEIFDKNLQVDAGLLGTATNPTTVWSGADHLEGEIVKVVADGSVRPEIVVTSGAVTLDEPAKSIQIGVAFRHLIEPLPPAIESVGGGHGAKIRPVAITFRFLDTGALRLDSGQGPIDVSFKRVGDSVLDRPPTLFSGDRTVRALGWRSGAFKPLWRIEQDTPLPFTLLSVSSIVSINR